MEIELMTWAFVAGLVAPPLAVFLGVLLMALPRKPRKEAMTTVIQAHA